MKLKALILITFSTFFFFNNLFAEEDPVIVISAGKTIQSKSTVGSNVTVISAEDIRNSSESFLGNIIDTSSTSTNMFQSGGQGTIMSIQLRGLEKRYSTVYIDGVKMSDPASTDNSFYFQNIMKESIERVEILKGNQSTLYGPNAIGGTIHIFTKKGKKEQKPVLEVKTGSNKSKSINYSIGGANDKINYYLGLNRFLTGGISARNDDGESDKYRNEGLNSNLEYKFNDEFKFYTSVRYVNSDLKYDAVSKSSTDLNDRSDDIEGSYTLKFIHDKNKFNNTFNYNKTYIERKTTETANTKQNYFGFRDSINWVGTYNLNLDNRVVYGVDAEFDSARYRGDYAPSAMNFKKHLLDRPADEHIFSRYFDYQFRPLENLHATFGLRSDEHSSTGRKTSGRSTLAYKLNGVSTIRSSYGSGVRFPSLYDLHYNSGNTNAAGGGSKPSDNYKGLTVEDIGAERANSYDIGYETYFDNFNLGFNLSYFNIEQKNPLVGDARNGFRIQNEAGINKTEGIELLFDWKPQDTKFDAGFNYTFTDSYDSNTCDENIVNFRGCHVKSSELGDAKVRVPRNAFAANISHNTLPNLKNSLQIKFVDEVRDFGDGNNGFKDVILEDYTTIDITTHYNLFDMYDLSFQAKNIFDDNYEHAHGYSAPGRSFLFGLKKVY